MYDKIISELISSKAVKAVQFLSPTKIVRVVRTTYDNKFSQGNIQLTVTIGRPNYLERDFLKQLKKQKIAVPQNPVFKFLKPKKKKVAAKKKKK